MAELLTFLVIVTLSLLVVKVGTIALEKTGLSREASGFQSQSAFMGVGFTTAEAESVVNHPVRRRIIRGLMLLGFGAITSTIGTLLATFSRSEEGDWSPGTKLALIGAGLLVLWVGASLHPIERLLERVIRRALEKMTDLRILDYEEMLKLHKGYTIANLAVDETCWMANCSLRDLQLAEEGILILSITRPQGLTLATPSSRAELKVGDRVLCYGLEDDLARLGSRTCGDAGDEDHEAAKKRQRLRLVEERVEDKIAESESEAEVQRDPEMNPG